MRLCFVIQPFDAGPFDARYDDTLAPAIRAAGFEPYRVDRDPAAVIPIDQIERTVRDADVCVADISLNNPNVWLELGLALAAGKPVVLIANAASRKKFPFDIQHRTVIRYRTEAERDFHQLRRELTTRLIAIAERPAVAPGVIRSAISVVDQALREEAQRAEDLRQLIATVNAEKEAFFSRIQRVAEIRANRAYENVDEPGLAREIHALAAKESRRFAQQYGLDDEWLEWLRLKVARRVRRARR